MSSQAVDRFYSRWARLYDLISRRTPGIRALRRRTIGAIGLSPGDTVVEMGCGPGPNFGPLRDAVGADGTVVGLDLAGGALARAQRHVRAQGWGNVHVLRGDATRPPVDAADAILGTFVVGMVGDPAAVIERWCDVVGSGGRIGLLHFARSDRRYGAVPNGLLRLLVLTSTPGRRRTDDATALLDRRVRAAHTALASRCDRITHHTRWGGLAHIAVGRVTQP